MGFADGLVQVERKKYMECNGILMLKNLQNEIRRMTEGWKGDKIQQALEAGNKLGWDWICGFICGFGSKSCDEVEKHELTCKLNPNPGTAPHQSMGHPRVSVWKEEGLQGKLKNNLLDGTNE